MALAHHGVRRFTEDVEILVTREGLKQILESLDGRDWTRSSPKSKNLRDSELHLRIDFLVTCDIPGDGKTKEISFPDPELVAVEQGGIRYVRLPQLIDLKLASGITGGDRLKDLADVQELIKLLNLSRDFESQLHSYVRPKFRELWESVHARPKWYVRSWLPGATADLETMLRDGVTINPEGGTAAGHVRLVTTDPEIAKKYDMHEEGEFWDEE